MIMKHVYPDGTTLIEIHCGCCGMFFIAAPGGNAFCDNCLNGVHQNCKVAEIMGIKK